MIRHVTSVQTINDDAACRIVDQEGFQDQRKRSANHVAFLREVMQRGEFDGGEPIRFAVYGGARYLINGQHRLEAIATGGGTQTVVVVESYCDTPEEAAILYARIDRGRGRNIADALSALGRSDMGLTKRQMMTVMTCAPYFANNLRGGSNIQGSSYNSKSAEGRASTMTPWLPAARKYFAAIGEPQFGNVKFFYLRDVVMVAIATFADLPASEKAHDFWAGMASDDGLHKYDPRKQCLEMLKRKRTRSALVRPYFAHGATICWNAWMRGHDVKLVKVHDDTAPLKIAGTRFEHRRADGSLDLKRAPMITPDSRQGEWLSQSHANT